MMSNKLLQANSIISIASTGPKQGRATAALRVASVPQADGRL